jgi:hypothetical protein
MDPARPVRLLIGYAAGGPADTLARLLGQALSERLGQPFVIENRPGAGTNIAADAVAKAAPDGYTLLMATAANAINTTLYSDLRFDFSRDFTPVTPLAREPLIMTVPISGPAKTLPEFIAYAKANPGKAHHRIRRQWHGVACLRRAVQDADRHRHGPRALPRRDAGADRSAQRTGGYLLLAAVRSDRVRADRQAARAGGHDDEALRSAARPPGCE